MNETFITEDNNNNNTNNNEEELMMKCVILKLLSYSKKSCLLLFLSFFLFFLSFFLSSLVGFGARGMGRWRMIALPGHPFSCAYLKLLQVTIFCSNSTSFFIPRTSVFVRVFRNTRADHFRQHKHKFLQSRTSVLKSLDSPFLVDLIFIINSLRMDLVLPNALSCVFSQITQYHGHPSSSRRSHSRCPPSSCLLGFLFRAHLEFPSTQGPYV